MLRKSFLPAVSGWFTRRNNFIVNITCYSTLTGSSHVDSKEAEYVNDAKVKEEIEKMRLKTPKNKKKSILDNEKLDIVSHVQSIDPNLIDTCPNSFINIRRDTNVLYLIDRDAAAKFVSIIIDDLSKNTCFIAELNPGFGFLTTELLKAGIPHIHLYEAKNELHPILDKLCDKYSGKLDLRHFNLIKISQLLHIDRETDGKLVEEALQGVQTKKWEDETCMQVIGATNTQIFFRHLIFSLLFRNSFMSYGRPVLYIAISPSLWHKYTCSNSNYNIYTTKKVMFQTMFNYEHLGTLNRKAFLPWPRKKRKQKNKSWNYNVQQMDYDEIYVIKLEPKIDIYSIFSQEDWIIFWYFLRHIMYKRCNRVIPELEKWIPGCGIRLIAKNYTIYMRIGDLTPEQLVDLFKEFKSWPEYKTCSFLTSMKMSLNTYNEPAILGLNNEDDEI